MTRNPFDLDLALLERRRWLADLATRRGCSLEEARLIEQEDRRYTRLWRTILAVLALGTAFILGGLS